MLFIDFWTSISLHSFEWTLVHKSTNIHVVFCFLLQSGEELHGSSVHSGKHHTDFLHCCHHEQEANSRLEGKILPTNIQSFAMLVIFKIQWFGAPCPLSSRSRPNYWTLQCILQLDIFPNHFNPRMSPPYDSGETRMRVVPFVITPSDLLGESLSFCPSHFRISRSWVENIVSTWSTDRALPKARATD